MVPPNCVGVPENEARKPLVAAEVTGVDVAGPGAPATEKLPVPLWPLKSVCSHVGFHDGGGEYVEREVISII